MPATPSDPRRLPLALAAAALAVIGFAACSTPAPSQGELSEALVASGLSEEVADCTSAALTKSLTKSELAELTERGAGGAPVDDTDRTDDSYDEMQKALATCRELQIASQPTTTTVPPVPDDDGANSGAVPTVTTTIADGTGGAEINPASTTTTAAP